MAGASLDGGKAGSRDRDRDSAFAAPEGPKDAPSDVSLGGLVNDAADIIEDHLRLFRAGCLILMGVSVVGLGAIAYKRGVRGFRSVAEIPTDSYVRRTVLKARFAGALQVARARRGVSSTSREDGEVLLLVKHCPLAWRLMRLVGWPQRDWEIFYAASGTARDAATAAAAAGAAAADGPGLLVLRLFGIRLEPEGLSWIQKELPGASRYIEVELLCRQQIPPLGSAGQPERPTNLTPGVAPPPLADAAARGSSRSEMGWEGPPPPPELVAVCNVRRRAGMLRRRRSVAEELLRAGRATTRDEEDGAAWMDAGPFATACRAAATATSDTATATGGDAAAAEGAIAAGALGSAGPAGAGAGASNAHWFLQGEQGRLQRAEEEARNAGRGVWVNEGRERSVAGAARSLLRGLWERLAGG